MSYGISIDLDGEVHDLLYFFNNFDKFLRNHSVSESVSINNHKKRLKKLKKEDKARVGVFVISDIDNLNGLIQESKNYPKLAFQVEIASTNNVEFGCNYKVISFKNEKVKAFSEFKTLLSRELSLKNALLNSKDVKRFLKEEYKHYSKVKYMSFELFLEKVLNNCEDIKFEENYTEDDLKKDIKSVYKSLNKKGWDY